MDFVAILAAVLAACCIVLIVAPLRRLLVSRLVLRWYRGQLPAMSRPSARR